MVGEPDFAMIPSDEANFAAAITEALAVLEVSTVRGKESEDKAALGDAVYRRTLQGYPADVALSALHELTLTSRWAPSLSEIVEKCEKLVQKRRDLLFALEWSSKQTKQALLPKPAPVRDVDFEPAPDLLTEPRPPLRSAHAMAEALRSMES